MASSAQTLRPIWLIWSFRDITMDNRVPGQELREKFIANGTGHLSNMLLRRNMRG